MDTVITVSEQTPAAVIRCEQYISWMSYATFVPAIRSPWRTIRYIIPALNLGIFTGAAFCILWYPDYYTNQKEIWTADIIIGVIVYAYMLYIERAAHVSQYFESIEMKTSVQIISMGFYVLFMLYWLYFAVVQFNIHNNPSILVQLGNIYMSYSWYLFFSIMAMLYYFITIKLQQRASSIRSFLKNLKRTRPSAEDFFKLYAEHHQKIKHFSRFWNFLVFLGFLLLTFHVPADLVSIIYSHFFYDIPGFIIKFAALMWYTYCICYLNNYETKIIPYIYKHKIYAGDELEQIEKYISYRKIGFDFYGIKLNGGTILKVAIIMLNLVIPTLYALFSNQILNLPASR